MPTTPGPGAQSFSTPKISQGVAEYSNYHMHGELYTHDDALAVSLPTADAPVISTGWTNNLSSGPDYVVIDGTNGTITIGDKGAGVYKIKGNVSFSSTRANVVIHAYMTVNNVKQNNLAFRRSVGTANIVGNANTQDGYVLLAPGDVICFTFESDTNTTTIDIDHGGFSILWIAGDTVAPA